MDHCTTPSATTSSPSGPLALVSRNIVLLRNAREAYDLCKSLPETLLFELDVVISNKFVNQCAIIALFFPIFCALFVLTYNRTCET